MVRLRATDIPDQPEAAVQPSEPTASKQVASAPTRDTGSSRKSPRKRKREHRERPARPAQHDRRKPHFEAIGNAQIKNQSSLTFLAATQIKDAPWLRAVKGPKRRRLLLAIVITGNVHAAHVLTKICRRVHYQAMRKEGPIGDAYRAAFEEAVNTHNAILETELIRRAVYGTEKLKFHNGKPIMDPRDPTGSTPYVEFEKDTTALIFALKAALPDKYGDKMKVDNSLRIGDSVQIYLPDNGRDSAAAATSAVSPPQLAAAALSPPIAVIVNGNGHSNGNGNGHANGHSNGHSNGHE